MVDTDCTLSLNNTHWGRYGYFMESTNEFVPLPLLFSRAVTTLMLRLEFLGLKS